jgi:hypothetical protein
MRLLLLLLCVWGCSGKPTGAPQAEPSTSTAQPQPGPLAATTVSGIPLEPMTFLDGKATLLIPKDFGPMREEMIKIKYPRERPPTVVYTNERGSVNVALNHTASKATAAQLPSLHKSMEDTFKKTFPTAEWVSSEMVTINGRRWFLLDLWTPTIDTTVRNMIVGTSLNGRLLLVTFNVTKELEETWSDAGKAVIESLRISE